MGIDKDQVKADIDKLFNKKPEKVFYYSDIVRALKIDLELVVDICEELINEGKIEVAKNIER